MRDERPWAVQATLDVSRLRPSSVLTVYHGTIRNRLPDFLYGFDANQIVPRYYTSTGNRHAGVYVSPYFDTAEGFGSTVLELKVQARNLHGATYGGAIGREVGRVYPGEIAGARRDFPHSFRPYLSQTLSNTVEPQALLRGLVRPGQIKRVFTDGKWYSRDALLASGLVPGKQVGHDMSYPNFTYEQVIDVITADLRGPGRRHSPEETEKHLRWAIRNVRPDQFEHTMRQFFQGFALERYTAMLRRRLG